MAQHHRHQRCDPPRVCWRLGQKGTAYERDADVAAREAGYRIHVNSTGTSALHAALEPIKCRSCVPVDAWEPSNVTVMGDAIHAMSPALGIGANTALRDAHTLGEELLAVARGDKPLLDGIGVYEDTMRDYAYHALRMSAFVGQKVIGHLPLPE